MEGDFPQRTSQPGQVMFPTHQTEVRDAKHEKGPQESNPPAAEGDRSPAERADRELIAPTNRPSFLQALWALWGAEDDLEQMRGEDPSTRKRPQPDNPNQEEKP